MSKKQKIALAKIVVSASVLIAVIFLPIPSKIKFLLYIMAYLLVGANILKKAVFGIIHLKPFDENFLMAVATIGAIILGEYTEGVAVMLFFQIGELFQSYAVRKSRINIAELMDVRPDYANVFRDGDILKVNPDIVEIGEIILVKPGEKVPIDGVILEGVTSFDTACLTGESMPRDLEEGDEVLGGYINLSGAIKVRTTKKFSESTASKILELLESASFRKSKSENFIRKFAKVYTPIVCGLAVMLAVIPPVADILMGYQGEFSVWIYRALTFLVMSCPCALVISIPLGFFASLGGASKEGILIKGSNYIETLSRAKHIVFDKTGTLTKGVFEVKSINTQGVEREELLEYASLAEIYSNHPISQCIKRAYKKEIDYGRIKNAEELAGFGVKAVIDEKEVLVGNERLMEDAEVSYIKGDEIGTYIHVAIDGVYTGSIVVSDRIKPTAKDVITTLKKIGVKTVTMLTGDIKNVAEKISRDAGTDKVHAELLPYQKVEILEGMINKKRNNEAVIFVGDGINDAPSITRADIGIAMGNIGADSAIEAADVVLMDDNLEKIPKAIAIAKKCMRIAYQNIYLAIGVKGICLIMGAMGIFNMWAAIFADVGVMVLAVLNAMRNLRVKM